ncbi:trypsin-like peptidase domain-containing protein [Streptomyces sp. FXJ1.172]|uniref:trypsin-like peptidase domain-containing protein n=1 Tax=Streptomyces sp. FXJ1.172 TaxID=710705 RepID=UPI0023DD4D44|nr:trypsin-like peptidase domain-containing protein [Streptomyces sp. FXJ1.172]WEO94492.1 trypsin-like serine protease [Streptomyces sp. FXJ1.172]
MTRTGERAVTSRLRTPSWIARIEAPDGRVLGAGVLLAPDRVLTAAHVAVPGRRYAVRLVAVPGLDAVPATVHEDEHVPLREDAFGDRSGDLALLRLARPLPAEHTTRLYRLAAPHGPVSMYGFPDGDDGGRWHGATLVAARGRDSQVQLRPLTPGELAAPGFSGGGVVDHATDQVIGIVLSVDEGPGSAFSYMSPTETILSHLPQAAAWTDGAEAVDPRLRTGARGGAGVLDVPFATELASWFRGEGWPVLVTVVPARSDRAWTLNRAVTLADRELRTDRNTSVFSHDPPETVPPAGAHDLALDVKGLTAAEVMDRVAARLGIRDDPRPERLGALRVPLAAVLVGVDQAAEPGALLGLLDRLARQGPGCCWSSAAEGSGPTRPPRRSWTGRCTTAGSGCTANSTGSRTSWARPSSGSGTGCCPAPVPGNWSTRPTAAYGAPGCCAPGSPTPRNARANPAAPTCCSPSRRRPSAAARAWSGPSATSTPGCTAARNSSAG